MAGCDDCHFCVVCNLVYFHCHITLNYLSWEILNVSLDLLHRMLCGLVKIPIGRCLNIFTIGNGPIEAQTLYLIFSGGPLMRAETS